MDNVLITGGTGFVGHWMQQTQPNAVNAWYFSHHLYDVGLWKQATWSYIVHLAPIAPYEVIEKALDDGARLLYCSSGIVYHPQNNTKYRRNKLNWEKYCLDSDADVVVARLFTFYGDHLDDNKAITQFTKAAQAGEPIKIWGDGSCVRSYMSGEEMGKWMWAILLHGKSGEAYDVGSNIPITMLELAGLINHRYGNKSEIIVEGGADPMPYYVPKDIDKTKVLLND